MFSKLLFVGLFATVSAESPGYCSWSQCIEGYDARHQDANVDTFKCHGSKAACDGMCSAVMPGKWCGDDVDDAAAGEAGEAGGQDSAGTCSCDCYTRQYSGVFLWEGVHTSDNSCQEDFEDSGFEKYDSCCMDGPSHGLCCNDGGSDATAGLDLSSLMDGLGMPTFGGTGDSTGDFCSWTACAEGHSGRVQSPLQDMCHESQSMCEGMCSMLMAGEWCSDSSSQDSAGTCSCDCYTSQYSGVYLWEGVHTNDNSCQEDFGKKGFEKYDSCCLDGPSHGRCCNDGGSSAAGSTFASMSAAIVAIAIAFLF